MSSVERRQGDRRSENREPGHSRQPDESWFGALGDDTQLPDDQWTQTADFRFEGGSASAAQAEDDSRFPSRQARPMARAEPSAFQRIYRVFLGARAALVRP